MTKRRIALIVKIQNLTEEEVFHALLTSPDGLCEDEASRRLHEYGLNQIKEIRKKPLCLKFLSQFTHFLAVLLWLAVLLCFLSEYLHPGEGMLTLGLAITGVIFINAFFTFIQEFRTEKALDALKRLLPFFVNVLREGKERQIDAKEVVPGDILLLSEGDKIPADARLIEAFDLKVNNAPLTGESDPISRSQEPSTKELLDSPNIVFAGTTVTSGSGRAVAYATGMTTEFGRIAHLTSAVESGRSPLQKEIIRTTRIIAAVACAIGLFFFSLGFVIGRSFWDNFLFAIGITVALIPEGMLPTMTLSLAMGSQRMVKRKALIKTLTSVETLGAVTVICTDKTGTLTQNRMSVRTLWVHDTFLEAQDVTKETDTAVLRVAALCNNARFVSGQFKGDPTEVALLRFVRDILGDRKAERISEIPFDSERKLMTVVCREQLHLSADNHYVAYSKGALESILPLCSSLHVYEEDVLLTDEIRKRITHSSHTLMDMGLRVLSFAYRKLEDSYSLETVESDMVFAGLIGLEDPPRPEVPEAIRKCKQAGIRVIMITGDGGRTAVAIGREIGLVGGNPTVIEGHAFNQMSDRELRSKLAEREILFTRMTPKHKMRVVSILQEEGEIVAVTGDGVNDAPALKKADIGISMGITGTDVAKEASDIVLLDDNFATIVNAVEEGRAVFENIKKFLTYIFASNIPEAVPYLAYILFKIPLPLTIIQILAVDLGTDMLPALGLGSEQPTPDVMKRPPRKMKERLLNFRLLGRAYLFLGPIEACACMFGFFYVLYGGGWTLGAILPSHHQLYLQATTACLTAIIITQIGNVFACRSESGSVFTTGFFQNRILFSAILIEILLQIFIVYHPFGNKIFGTAPIGVEVWLILLPFAVFLIVAEEIRKAIARGSQQAS